LACRLAFGGCDWAARGRRIWHARIRFFDQDTGWYVPFAAVILKFFAQKVSKIYAKIHKRTFFNQLSGMSEFLHLRNIADFRSTCLI
jgi:hypothetical protein